VFGKAIGHSCEEIKQKSHPEPEIFSDDFSGKVLIRYPALWESLINSWLLDQKIRTQYLQPVAINTTAQKAM